MERIQANVRIKSLVGVENLQEILAQEYKEVAKWYNDEILEHLYLKSDKTGAIIIFKDITIEKAKDLVPTLPLFPYFDNVEYSIIERKI